MTVITNADKTNPYWSLRHANGTPDLGEVFYDVDRNRLCIGMSPETWDVLIGAAERRQIGNAEIARIHKGYKGGDEYAALVRDPERTAQIADLISDSFGDMGRGVIRVVVQSHNAGIFGELFRKLLTAARAAPDGALEITPAHQIKIRGNHGYSDRALAQPAQTVPARPIVTELEAIVEVVPQLEAHTTEVAA